ncbi:MAG: TetR/AcrR family transcriptional regulator [Novosphingobium sp.]|nr:TetR/AcrR family transcriptional regulator [Novosphingobium sp.]
MTEAANTQQEGAAQHSGRRRPGRPTLSNEELLDTALDLFLEKGFERTSIDAITAAAGMAKRTIYARYGDKTRLFKAALTRAIEEWIVPVERLQAIETDDLEETLVRIGDILVANILSPAGLRLLRLTNAESVRMPEISMFNVRHGTEPTLAYLADLFSRRLQRGDGSGADAESAAQAFLSLVVGGVANNAAWGQVVEPDAADEHVRYSVRLFLSGLLALHGEAIGGEPARIRVLLDEAAAELEKARDKLDQASRLSGS